MLAWLSYPAYSSPLPNVTLLALFLARLPFIYIYIYTSFSYHFPSSTLFPSLSLSVSPSIKSPAVGVDFYGSETELRLLKSAGIVTTPLPSAPSPAAERAETWNSAAPRDFCSALDGDRVGRRRISEGGKGGEVVNHRWEARTYVRTYVRRKGAGRFRKEYDGGGERFRSRGTWTRIPRSTRGRRTLGGAVKAWDGGRRRGKG